LNLDHDLAVASPFRIYLGAICRAGALLDR
jgi:hypothetical protein